MLISSSLLIHCANQAKAVTFKNTTLLETFKCNMNLGLLLLLSMALCVQKTERISTLFLQTERKNSRIDLLYNITPWYQNLYIVIQTDIEMNSLLQITLQLFSPRFITYKNNTTNTSSSIHSNDTHLSPFCLVSHNSSRQALFLHLISLCSLSILFVLLSSFEVDEVIYQISCFWRISILLLISSSLVTFSHLYENDKILSIIRVVFNKACVSCEIWHDPTRFIVALFYSMLISQVSTLLLQPLYENDCNNDIETTCLLDAFGCVTLSIYDDSNSYFVKVAIVLKHGGGFRIGHVFIQQFVKFLFLDGQMYELNKIEITV